MYVIRNMDIVSGNDDLEEIISLQQFPSFMGCVDTPPEDDILSDMSFNISKATGMIQLNPVLDLDVVYRQGHDSGLTGKSWIDHHRNLADFIKSYSPSEIFEIGGGHGILNAEFTKKYGEIPWTILESNPSPIDECRAEFIKGFYNSETQINNSVDMIVHSHCLEHFYNPTEFFENTLRLAVGTKMCFSVPYLEAHLSQCFTNVMNFEHTYFCTENFIEYWLSSYGFKLLDKKYYGTDHSIFYAAEKVDGYTKIDPPMDYEKNLSLFQNWIDYHKTLVDDLNQKIDKSDRPIFLFGAHVFTQFLIAFGLNIDNINSILDNNQNKQNKRLYGTLLTVQSPKILKDYVNPLVILRSGVFNNEIKEDILNNVNPNAEFLV